MLRAKTNNKLSERIYQSGIKTDRSVLQDDRKNRKRKAETNSPGDWPQCGFGGLNFRARAAFLTSILAFFPFSLAKAALALGPC
jgi:hypothetical protein